MTRNQIKIVWIFLFFCLSSITLADGKLLRGEKWQQYSNTETSADFYVSPDGNDSWSGTLAEPNANKTDGPFATITRAQQAVRDLKKQVYFPKDEPVEKRWIGSPHELGKGKDILVLIRDGFYTLNAPVVFGSLDGGERVETNLPTGAFEYHKLKDHYVTWAAYPGEKPVISGGKPVSGWSKKGDQWTAKVDGSVNMLVAEGRKQILARTPDKEYFTPPVISKTDTELYFRKGDLDDWEGLEGNRIKLLLRWHAGLNSIKSIDVKKGVATLEKPQPGIVIVPPRFYVENVKELLNAPGEWFYDNEQKELSYIPENGTNPNQTHLVIPELKELFVIKGTPDKPVRNLRIYGLTFESTLEKGKAVSMEYAHSCELVGSRLSAIAGTGVFLGDGCYLTKILDNSFEMIDSGVIHVIGNPHPMDWRDIIRETTISRNVITNCGGVNIVANNTQFTTISHNVLSYTRGRYAIEVGGWRNLEESVEGGYRVEYNHLYQVQKDADDSGAIKTTGLTYDSIVRRNLVHDVIAGYFNDNVGFWFDNMSSGWISEENIFYNLQQGEMKLCAANLVDNIYRNNYVIEAPEISPQGIIEGEPEFSVEDLLIQANGRKLSGTIETGTFLTLTAQVHNSGATGIMPVQLYLDGKVYETQSIPVIQNNTRTIEFGLRLFEPGEHRVAIGDTPYQSVNVQGAFVPVVYKELILDHDLIPEGEIITVSSTALNQTGTNQSVNAVLMMNGASVQQKQIKIDGNSSVSVQFELEPKAGDYTVQIGNSPQKKLSVFAHQPVKIKKSDFKVYCSGTAFPYKVDIDKKGNKIKIEASGSDFYHAEDSYASAYFKGVKGNFVATVKVNGFGNRTHEWFRTGLFARNDISKSFDTEPGSKGSVLMFTTPGRAGINYDEFGDGCMHKASSANLPEDIKYPVWLKLIRHGNSFTGYVSLDGKTWTRERNTNDLPGLNETIDIGLAGGSCDKVPYWVEFQDFKLSVENK